MIRGSTECQGVAAVSGRLGLVGLVVLAVVAMILPGSRAGAAADTTPPWIKVSVAGPQGANGWFTGDATVSWTLGDPQSGVATSTGCGSTVVSQESRHFPVTCSATDGAGLQRTRTKVVRLDRTAPSVVAVPSRPPDSQGWYNHPVSVAFQGGDSTSGIASCTSAVYSGPDAASASVTGSCEDNAGLAADAAFALDYDSTAPPAVSGFRAVPGDHLVSLQWTLPAAHDFDHVSVTRIGPVGHGVVYTGTAVAFVDRGVANGSSYGYSVVAYDHAGNASRAETAIAVPKLLLLRRPANGARVATPPRLRWLPTRRATYYNVQVWRDGTKILSTWPRRTFLDLSWSWRYAGHRFRLKPGAYRWFVWPGFGRARPVRYGPLLGASTFVVVG